MSKPRITFYYFLSYVFLSVGLIAFLYGTSLVWNRFMPAKFSELDSISYVAVENSNAKELFAVQLLLSDHNLKVPVIPGNLVDGEWQLSNDAALVIQSDEQSQLATVVYGHNIPKILGGLHKVHVGEQFELVMNDWSKKQYKVMEVMEVSPDEVQVLFTNSSNDLIVYTCSGFLDSKRFVVRARLVEALAST